MDIHYRPGACGRSKHTGDCLSFAESPSRCIGRPFSPAFASDCLHAARLGEEPSAPDSTGFWYRRPRGTAW